ncbi:MAG TPA: hypothetical protein VHZ03_07785 [Trebonia sp.]|jgi:hypothetical protein|nr:hypothetical protein [Trebonia sp.]
MAALALPDEDAAADDAAAAEDEEVAPEEPAADVDELLLHAASANGKAIAGASIRIKCDLFMLLAPPDNL